MRKKTDILNLARTSHYVRHATGVNTTGNGPEQPLPPAAPCFRRVLVKATTNVRQPDSLGPLTARWRPEARWVIVDCNDTLRTRVFQPPRGIRCRLQPSAPENGAGRPHHDGSRATAQLDNSGFSLLLTSGGVLNPGEPEREKKGQDTAQV